MSQKSERYLPALRFRWLTPLYDPVLRWGMRESGFKHHLVEQLALRPGMSVMDLGCGTGTLTIMIKQCHPGAEVYGIDGDSQVLAIASEKAVETGVTVQWDLGLAYDLPYRQGSFDRVVSSLVFHHLTMPDKRRTMAEVFRVLRPGGELHILDFGKPYNLYTRLAASVIRHFEETAAQLDGQLPGMLASSGFINLDEIRHFTTIFGPLTALRAVKPAGAGQ